jgi:hypothetical protein
MERKKIDARKFIADIRSGASDEFLMEKYSLNKASLDHLFNQIKAKGLIKSDNYPDNQRAGDSEKRQCPSCGEMIPKDNEDC